VWRQSKTAFLGALSQGDVIIKRSEKNGFTVYLKDRIKDGRKPKTFWSNPKYDASSHGTILLKDMLGEKLFSYPKSIYLMEDVIKILSDDNDIILDYHAGSGTTGHAVLNVNKQKK
jgi:adenine-specific DNA-methyltransferase